MVNTQVAMLLPNQSSKLLQALSTWRTLWESALQKMPESHRMWLGVARYVDGIEYLSRRVIEVAVSPEVRPLHYLQRIPTYNTKELHDFIRDFVAKT